MIGKLMNWLCGCEGPASSDDVVLVPQLRAELARLREDLHVARAEASNARHELALLHVEYASSRPDAYSGRPCRFRDIRRWGSDRQIIQNSTAKAQFLKTVEETGELASALAKGRIVPDAIDAIGDIVVTLTLVAACEKLDIEDCIEHAWNTIKDRKGRLTPEGVFVREGT